MAERRRRFLRLRGEAEPAIAEQSKQHKRGSEEADDGEHALQSCKKPRCPKMLVTLAPRRPCYCPNHGCDEAFASPARLLDHFRTAHPSWPVTPVTYGRPCEVALPLHVLVGEADRRVFLVCSSSELVGRRTAVSVVCVRNNGDAAPQFDFTLLVQPPPGNVVSKVTFSGFLVPSSDLSGGLVAAEQLASLRLSSELLHGASGGEAPHVMVCIDKAGGVALGLVVSLSEQPM